MPLGFLHELRTDPDELHRVRAVTTPAQRHRACCVRPPHPLSTTHSTHTPHTPSHLTHPSPPISTLPPPPHHHTTLHHPQTTNHNHNHHQLTLHPQLSCARCVGVYGLGAVGAVGAIVWLSSRLPGYWSACVDSSRRDCIDEFQRTCSCGLWIATGERCAVLTYLFTYLLTYVLTYLLTHLGERCAVIR